MTIKFYNQYTKYWLNICFKRVYIDKLNFMIDCNLLLSNESIIVLCFSEPC